MSWTTIREAIPASVADALRTRMAGAHRRGRRAAVGTAGRSPLARRSPGASDPRRGDPPRASRPRVAAPGHRPGRLHRQRLLHQRLPGGTNPGPGRRRRHAGRTPRTASDTDAAPPSARWAPSGWCSARPSAASICPRWTRSSRPAGPACTSSASSGGWASSRTRSSRGCRWRRGFATRCRGRPRSSGLVGSRHRRRRPGGDRGGGGRARGRVCHSSWSSRTPSAARSPTIPRHKVVMTRARAPAVLRHVRASADVQGGPGRRVLGRDGGGAGSRCTSGPR